MSAYLNALGLLCALGHGKAEVAEGLFAGDSSGMQPAPGWIPERQPPVGTVSAALPTWPLEWTPFFSRNNQLLLAALTEIEPQVRQAIERHGPARIGVVLGTSTSGIHEASQGIAMHQRSGQLPEGYQYAQQELVAPADFLARYLGLSGPCYGLSTACTSSARALLSARRLLIQGQCDAVLCGGVDSLCGLTLNGFAALEAISDDLCNPFSVNRCGINIGEGAALFLLTREPGPIALLGGGASSDAHHISAPDPSGRGAIQAMQAALRASGLQPADIGYLNLHGTATPHNDAMESQATHQVFPDGVPCSSTKPLTGHTLGAAGALETAFAWLTLDPTLNPAGRLPPQRWDGQPDPALPRLALTTPDSRLDGRRHAMSNSFAFGGSNVSLILGATP